MHAPNVPEVECRVSNVIALFALNCRRDGAQIVKAMIHIRFAGAPEPLSRGSDPNTLNSIIRDPRNNRATRSLTQCPLSEEKQTPQ